MILIILFVVTTVLSACASFQYTRRKKVEKELTNYLLNTSQPLNVQMNAYRKLQENLVDKEEMKQNMINILAEIKVDEEYMEQYLELQKKLEELN